MHRTTGDESAPSLVPTTRPTALPTTPCSVVWSGGHSYVLEASDRLGRCGRWVGLDRHGRPLELAPADLQARGWTHTPH